MSEHKKKSTFIGKFTLFLVLVAAGAYYLFPVHQIKGTGMEPSIPTNSTIVTLRSGLNDKTITRGTIVTYNFKSTDGIDRIGRIIGVPGDKIRYEDQKLYLNNQPLEESYLKGPQIPLYQKEWFFEEGKEELIPQDFYVIFNDRRTNDNDSRTFGFIPKQNIKSTFIDFIKKAEVQTLSFEEDVYPPVEPTLRVNDYRSPTPEPATVYEDEKIRLTAPMYYVFSARDETSANWKAINRTNGFRYNAMVLMKSTIPFEVPEVGKELVYMAHGEREQVYEHRLPISGVEKTDYVTEALTGVQYHILCNGPDCYFHMLQFQIDDVYYQLIFDGAGGGLITRFRETISTITKK